MKVILIVLLFLTSCYNDKSTIISKSVISSIKLNEIDILADKHNDQPTLTLTIQNRSNEYFYLDNGTISNLHLEVQEKDKKTWKEYPSIWLYNQSLYPTDPPIVAKQSNDTLIKEVFKELIEATFRKCIDRIDNTSIDTSLVYRRIEQSVRYEVVLLAPGAFHKETLAISSLKSPTKRYKIYWHYQPTNEIKESAEAMDYFEICPIDYPNQLNKYQRVKAEVFSDTLYFELK